MCASFDKIQDYEYQLKIKSDLTDEDIINIGAKKIGSIIHEDRYYTKKNIALSHLNELIRIRKDDHDELVFTYKGPIANKKIRIRPILNKSILESELKEIKKKYVELICVNKKRTTYLKDGVIINLDNVDNLGTFVEFDVEKEEDAPKIGVLVNKLGLDLADMTKLSYFELALSKHCLYDKIMTAIVDVFGKFSFGIASAVLTTLGIIVGLNVATSSLIAVIGGIVAVAVADSLSDSIGMYSAEKSKRGVSQISAFKSALNVFLGKFVFTLTFIIPFLLFSVNIAIYISIIWGLLLLAFVNFQIAYIQSESIPKTILKNLGIAIFVIIVSYLAGYIVGLIG